MDLNTTIDSIAISNNQPQGMNQDQSEKMRLYIREMFKDVLSIKDSKTTAQVAALGLPFTREISNIAHQVCMEIYQKVNEDEQLRQRLDLWDIPEERLEDIGQFAHVKRQARSQLQAKGEPGTVRSLVSESLQIQEELSHELSFSTSSKSKPSVKFSYLQSQPMIQRLTPKSKPRKPDC